MALVTRVFLPLFFAVVAQGFPAADSVNNLPSMLAINSEEELGLYSKKWKMTPVQMCTLMGHQMTVAQPLLDINHPLVSHLPSIGEMAMSDAVMICEKVLNDAKGNIATITSVVEETRQQYSVPSSFMFDEEFQELTEDLKEAMTFSDKDMEGALIDNQEALIELMEEQKEQNKVATAPTEPPPPPTKAPTLAEKLGKIHTT